MLLSVSIQRISISSNWLIFILIALLLIQKYLQMKICKQVADLFTFARLVSWQSQHDVNDYGVRDIGRVVQKLERYGRVLISSEAPLPKGLRSYERKGQVGDIHHILAFAQLCFGESATKASEAAQLGVPSVFLSTLRGTEAPTG